jgi:hypothetical protein
MEIMELFEEPRNQLESQEMTSYFPHKTKNIISTPQRTSNFLKRNLDDPNVDGSLKPA